MSDLICVCGEPESEHYDEVNPPPSLGYGTDSTYTCKHHSRCGCEGFEAEQPGPPA